MIGLRQITAILLIFALSNCTSVDTGRDMTAPLYDLPQDCDFSKAGNNSTQSFDCSPQLKDPFFSEFQGILVNGPKDTEWPKSLADETPVVLPNGDTQGKLKLVISGLVKLPYETLDLDGELAKHVLLVAVNQESAESYSGKLIPFGFTAKPNVPGLAESQQGLDTTEYFNIDLVKNLEIPFSSAKYKVYATLGEYKSNVIDVNISVK